VDYKALDVTPRNQILTPDGLFYSPVVITKPNTLVVHGKNAVETVQINRRFYKVQLNRFD